MAKFHAIGEYRYGQCPKCKNISETMVIDHDGIFTCLTCGFVGDIHKKTESKSSKILGNARIYMLNKEACELFQKDLFSKYGNTAKEYVLEKRQLTNETIKNFGIGYASSNSYVQQTLLNKGFTKEEMAASGLWNTNEDGSLWFRFKDRVMFPIHDVKGNIIGFSGRVLDNSEPKYKNTPETEVFKKRENLFGFNRAIKSGKNHLILCEGQMDVIAMHQAGYTNAVASLGTALTDTQVRLMKRFTNRVIILYDTDDAGQKATRKAIDMLKAVGINSYRTDMNPCKDPDEFLKVYGKEEFDKKIKHPMPSMEFLVRSENHDDEWNMKNVAELLLSCDTKESQKIIKKII